MLFYSAVILVVDPPTDPSEHNKSMLFDRSSGESLAYKVLQPPFDALIWPHEFCVLLI